MSFKQLFEAAEVKHVIGVALQLRYLIAAEEVYVADGAVCD